MPRGLADGLAAAGLLGLLACAPWARSAGAPRCGGRHCCSSLRVFLSAWLGNAALIALGGEVHGRYGARLVWVAPLLAGVLALRAAAARSGPGAVETLAPPERNRYNPPIDARAAPAVRAVPGKVRW